MGENDSSEPSWKSWSNILKYKKSSKWYHLQNEMKSSFFHEIVFQLCLREIQQNSDSSKLFVMKHIDLLLVSIETLESKAKKRMFLNLFHESDRSLEKKFSNIFEVLQSSQKVQKKK